MIELTDHVYSRNKDYVLSYCFGCRAMFTGERKCRCISGGNKVLVDYYYPVEFKGNFVSLLDYIMTFFTSDGLELYTFDFSGFGTYEYMLKMLMYRYGAEYKPLLDLTAVVNNRPKVASLFTLDQEIYFKQLPVNCYMS